MANPVQVRTLLNAVSEQRRSGPRLVAFFGCLYFAAMRPEEAVGLAKPNLSQADHHPRVAAARREVFTEAVAASLLAATPSMTFGTPRCPRG